ncbi:MAG: enoyl-CoA hydratase/isomerase family protein [Phycisphaerae bacterium]|nr:enoyl-CoA hydratase/isomerase family protein [Phycisphaerae bacterium]
MTISSTLLPIQRDTADLPDSLPGSVVVRLDQPGSSVVVLDHLLLRRLELTLKTLTRDVTGLILASSSERVFVAGADLKAIDAMSDPELHAYLEFGSSVYAMISEMACPTVAAINGAALGGGLEIAMHCDARVACPAASGKPYPIGLPEASLALCPGWGGTNLLPALMDPAEAIRRTGSGKAMLLDEALRFGVVDAVADSAADLLHAARKMLISIRGQGVRRRDGAPSRWIGRPGVSAGVALGLTTIRGELGQGSPSNAMRAVMRAVETGLEFGWQAALVVEREELVRLRHLPEARAALRAFFERNQPKKP